ncbi:MAG: hypothetical protein ACR2MN_04450 [Acidimicrobiales bacterium]
MSPKARRPTESDAVRRFLGGVARGDEVAAVVAGQVPWGVGVPVVAMSL